MKKFSFKFFNLGLAIAAGMLYITPPILAEEVTPVYTDNYTEKFEQFTGIEDQNFAPLYWLHNVDKGTDSDEGYQGATEGGHDGGAYLKITPKCNPATYYYDCLVTPPVKGDVSFWVKGGKVTLYKCTFNNGVLSKTYNTVSLPADFTISAEEWQQVTVNLDEYTRLGIVFQNGEGGLDDFTAASADTTPFTYTTLGNVQYTSDVTADVTGKATVPISLSLRNGGTSLLAIDNPTVKCGATTYTPSSFTSVLGEASIASISLQPGESTEIAIDLTVTLEDPSKSERISYLGIEIPSLVGITKIGSLNINSLAGILGMRTSSGTLSADQYVECDVQRGEYVTKLYASNTGKSDVVISDVLFDGSLEDEITPFDLPFTLAPGADKLELPFTFSSTPGAKTGNVTLVYSDGITEDKEFTFSMGAGIVAEEGWLEDFQSVSTPNLPAGWLADGSFRTATYQSYDSRVRANSDTYKNSSMITSLMHLEKNGQLSLMASRQSVSDSHDKMLTIWISPDRENWTELGGLVAKEPAGRLPFNTFMAPGVANVMNWYNFSLKNVETGNYYVKFEAMALSLDNIFGDLKPVVAEHDMLLTSFSAPGSGEVNKELSVEVKVINMKSEPEADYVVTLYEGDTAVAEVAGSELEAYAEGTVKLAYMPHNAGEITLSAEVNVGEGFRTLKSSEVTADIATEECVASYESAQITKYDYEALTSSRFNKVEFYIPADQLSIPEGTVISEIAFYVYNSSTYSNVTIPYSCWIEEVEEVVPFAGTSDFDMPETTPSAAGTYTLEFGVSDASSPAKMIIPLDSPITYKGTGFKISMEMNLESAIYNFYVGIHSANEKYYHSYCKATENSGYVYPGGKSNGNVPVVMFRSELTPAQVTGRFVKNGVGVADAVVTLVESETVAEEDVQRVVAQHAAKVAYSGTTDSEGNFVIPVIKADRDYDLSASHAEFEYAHPSKVSLKAGDVTLDDIDVNDITVSVAEISREDVILTIAGESLTVAGADAVVYDAAGRLVAEMNAGVAARLAKGIYLVVISGEKKARKIVIR